MFAGWALSSAAMACLWALESTAYFHDDAHNARIAAIALLYFLFGLGFWFGDVIADSMMAEKAKLEPDSRRGHLQV